MIDWEEILNEPNDETYHPHIIESAYSGKYVEATTYEGSTALHIASNLDLHDNIKSLIETGADINAKDMFGFTPLHKAIMGQSLKTAAKLIVLKADMYAVDSKGMKPFDYCDETNRCFTLYKQLYQKNKIDYNDYLNKLIVEKNSEQPEKPCTVF